MIVNDTEVEPMRQTDIEFLQCCGGFRGGKIIMTQIKEFELENYKRLTYKYRDILDTIHKIATGNDYPESKINDIAEIIEDYVFCKKPLEVAKGIVEDD